MPRATAPQAHVPPRAAPSGARPRPRPATASAGAPRKGRASKLIILACGAVFLAALTLPGYYHDPGAKSLLKATSGDPNSPLYPQDFWIPVTLVALVLVLTVIGLLAPRRFPMVCATAAALGLAGYTLYLPTKGAVPGFGPFGSGYWLSLGAAAVMTLAGVAASIRSSRT
jgi:hypothetical protein